MKPSMFHYFKCVQEDWDEQTSFCSSQVADLGTNRAGIIGCITLAAMEPHQLNHISFLIIQSAIQIHRALGPGLLESIYRTCMIYELRERA
jgi:hypothetical protein